MNGLAPDNGKVIVNGATGGVGSLAIDMLARLGYAVDGGDRQRRAEQDYLKAIGAREVARPRSAGAGHTAAGKSARGPAAFDSVGGEQLAWLTRTHAARTG